MRKILFLLPFIFQFALAQESEVTNIQAAQRTDGSGIFDITYDLMPDALFEYFDVTVEVSVDGGSNFQSMSNFTGDYGQSMEPGTGYSLTWDFGAQFGETFSDQVVIKINATSTTIVINDTLEVPFEMVTIPAGEFTFGEGDTVKTIDYDYEIMKYEVTDQEYIFYLLDAMEDGSVNVGSETVTGPYPGDPAYPNGDYIYLDFRRSSISWTGEIFEVNEGFVNHPVTGVTWFGAWAFASYYGLTLPTEYEWEKAARGDTGWDYPWGDEITGQHANFMGSDEDYIHPTTTPVGYFNGDSYTFDTSNGRKFSFVGVSTWDRSILINSEDGLFSNSIEMVWVCHNSNCSVGNYFGFVDGGDLAEGYINLFLTPGGYNYEFDCDDGDYLAFIGFPDQNFYFASYWEGNYIGEFQVEDLGVISANLNDNSSVYSVYAMSGNVYEWLDKESDDEIETKLKGGSWFNQENYSEQWLSISPVWNSTVLWRDGNHNYSWLPFHYQLTGFRCVRQLNN